MNAYDFNASEVIHTGVLGFRKIEVNVKGDNSSITRWASWFSIHDERTSGKKDKVED